MIDTLHTIVSGALERLSQQLQAWLPPVLAALVILVSAVALAKLVRWLAVRLLKRIEMDAWLRRWGLASLLNRSGTLRASRLVAQGAYWTVILLGAAAALNALSPELSARVGAGAAVVVPRVLGAIAVALGGLWLGQFLGRSVLIWAVNEDLPSPRRLALGARALITLLAVVAAADVLGFAAGTFQAAFLIVLAGVTLAAGLALGIGASGAVRRHFERDKEDERRSSSETERSLWNHL